MGKGTPSDRRPEAKAVNSQRAFILGLALGIGLSIAAALLGAWLAVGS